MSSFAQSKTRLLQAFEEFVNAMEPAQSASPVKLATPDTSLASAAVDLATPAVPLATPKDSKLIASGIGSEIVLPSELSEDPMPTTAQSDVLLEASEAPKKASKKTRKKKPRTIKQVEASRNNFNKRWVPPSKQSENVLEEPEPRYEEPGPRYEEPGPRYEEPGPRYEARYEAQRPRTPPPRSRPQTPPSIFDSMFG